MHILLITLLLISFVNKLRVLGDYTRTSNLLESTLVYKRKLNSVPRRITENFFVAYWRSFVILLFVILLPEDGLAGLDISQIITKIF